MNATHDDDLRLAPASEAEYQAGFDAACDAYVHGQPAGDPDGVSESFRLGWWCGVGWSAAFEEGRLAARAGVLACPYTADDQECFIRPWQDGFMAAFMTDQCRPAAAGRMAS